MMFIKRILKRSSNTVCRYYSTRNMMKLKERGMYHDIFPEGAVKEVTDLLNAAPQCVYAGFDPTADSLHVGNLLVLINLLHWQRGGHNAIAVLGGATAKIGDPSGRTTEREVLTSKTIDDNIIGIQNNLKQVFENHQKYLWPAASPPLAPITIVNNEDWYNKLSAVELIGGAGRYLRMGTLLSRSSVHSRLESRPGMSYTEFSYPLFQSYDWLHLFKSNGCRFQIGGSDQMGNIMSGHELISKDSKTAVYGLTVPLVTTEMGDKFGKSAGNAVWLSSSKTSAFSFYQFWMRVTDAGVENLLKLFTFDTVASVADTMLRHREHPELRLAQKKLAEQITVLVHGKKGLEQAQKASKALYEGSAKALGDMTMEEITEMLHGLLFIVELLPEPGQSVLDMAMKAGCFPTNNDAVRIITAGGFYINQQRTTNPNEVLNPSIHRLSNNITLLRVGKKNYYVIKWLS